jgi:Tfp pilus assembly protein PilV
MNKGFSVVEVILGLAILSVSFFAMTSTATSFIRLSSQTTRNLQAALLLEDGIEGIRSIRDMGWTDYIAPLTNDVWYGLSFSTSTSLWSTSTSPTVVEGLFNRRFKTSEVERDANDDIVISGGTVDPDTRLFTLEIYWTALTTSSSRTVSTYFTNYFND